jgi:hypothetical protein
MYDTKEPEDAHKGNNKITELRTILQRESQNSQPYKQLLIWSVLMLRYDIAYLYNSSFISQRNIFSINGRILIQIIIVSVTSNPFLFVASDCPFSIFKLFLLPKVAWSALRL